MTNPGKGRKPMNTEDRFMNLREAVTADGTRNMTNPAHTAREARARRLARKKGYHLNKSRRNGYSPPGTWAVGLAPQWTTTPDAIFSNVFTLPDRTAFSWPGSPRAVEHDMSNYGSARPLLRIEFAGTDTEQEAFHRAVEDKLTCVPMALTAVTRRPLGDVFAALGDLPFGGCRGLVGGFTPCPR